MEKERDVCIDGIVVTSNVDEVLNDSNIDIVVEVMGGIEEAKEHIVKALQSKKHVVTANKDLMAVYGAELLQLANKNECDLCYEASVAGGIPILRGLTDGLASIKLKNNGNRKWNNKLYVNKDESKWMVV